MRPRAVGEGEAVVAPLGEVAYMADTPTSGREDCIVQRLQSTACIHGLRVQLNTAECRGMYVPLEREWANKNTREDIQHVLRFY